METFTFSDDITVMYVTAKTFPDGIMEAHKTLHEIVPFSTDRKYFGISRPENGPIIYRAAAEVLNPGEAENLNCDTLILKKGEYICITIQDYMKDLQSIERSFQKLLSNPDLDPEGYCVEWYVTGKDVRCMIRLNR